MVLTDMKLYQGIGLEVVREQVLSPNPSSLAIVVKAGNRQLQRCAMYCSGERLAAVDAFGVSKDRASPSNWRDASLPYPQHREAHNGLDC